MINEKSDPLVSVVIPTIKFDAYTEVAIRSIAAQTYDNWEIVLVLDGAPSSSVPEWVKKDSRITIVVHNSRLGTPLSLNDGAKASKGEYIARLDADDIAHPERLDLQVRYLRENPNVVCVGTPAFIIDEECHVIAESPRSMLKHDVRPLMVQRNPLIHSSVIYRRDSFFSVEGYNPIMKRTQDYDLYLRLARRGPISLMDRPLCAYRVHLGQHSRKTSPFSKYTLELLSQRNELRKYLGFPLYTQLIKDVLWYIAQVVRHLGLRKPAYLKNKVNRNTLYAPEDLDWLNI